MKKVVLLLICAIYFISCDKLGLEDTTNIVTQQKTTGYGPIHIAFRSHPLNGQECVGSFKKCPDCTCPLFICICTTLFTSAPLTDQEKNDLIGEAEIKLTSNNTKLKMIFHQQADSSGFVHLYKDEYFPQQVADSMGVNSILVKAGLYPVDFNTYTYGEATFDCQVD